MLSLNAPQDRLNSIIHFLNRMSFTESNTVEQMILEAATSLGSGSGGSVLRDDPPSGWGVAERAQLIHVRRWR